MMNRQQIYTQLLMDMTERYWLNNPRYQRSLAAGMLASLATVTAAVILQCAARDEIAPLTQLYLDQLAASLGDLAPNWTDTAAGRLVEIIRPNGNTAP